MNKILLYKFLVIAIVFYQNAIFSQTINLGIAANFVLFTSTGAVANTGTSHISGNLGTNTGAVSDFSNIDGVVHNGDAVSANCSNDLLIAYNQLNTITPTSAIGPLIGNGQNLFSGVYSINKATSLNSCLRLDARGDSNAVFIFQIQGTFSTGPSSKIVLINGALACNVFWKVEGAISIATGSFMRGTFIANNAAFSMAVGDTLEGRAFSTTGAIAIDGTLAYLPKGCGSSSLKGPPAPILGTTADFAIFSSNGLVKNTGITNVTGDVGMNLGVCTGHISSNVNGVIHSNPDSSTSLCSNDLLNLYDYLNNLPPDIELLYPANFGKNLVLTPHVYIMNAAVVFTDTLYLNAQNNTDAVFVIKIQGALTTSTYSKVKLINGAQSKNVFWVINGAATINNYSTFRGAIICNNGDIVLNTEATVDGGLFTAVGDINSNSVSVANLNISSNTGQEVICHCPISYLPIELLTFEVECENQNITLNWSTASETNNNYYTIERSGDGINWQNIVKINGNGNTINKRLYSFIDINNSLEMSYYRLKQTDFDENIKYSTIVDIIKCDEDFTELSIYPNPANEIINISIKIPEDKIISISILNDLGEMVYYSERYQSQIVFEDKLAGVYFIQIKLKTKNIIKKFVIVK